MKHCMWVTAKYGRALVPFHAVVQVFEGKNHADDPATFILLTTGSVEVSDFKVAADFIRGYEEWLEHRFGA